MLKKLIVILFLITPWIRVTAAPTQNEIIYTDIRGSQTLGLITTGTPYIVNARMDPATYGMIISGAWGDNVADVSTKLPVLAGVVSTSTPAPTNGNMAPLYMNGSGALYTTCTNCGNGSGGTSITDNAAFTAGSTGLNVGGGLYDTSNTSNQLTAGHAGAFHLTQNRALEVNIVNSAGTEASPLVNGTNATLLNASIQFTGATTTQLIAAVAGKRIKVMAISCSNPNASTLGSVEVQDGSAGTQIWFTSLGGGGTISASVPYPSFLFATTAGNGLYGLYAVEEITCNMTYWTQDSN